MKVVYLAGPFRATTNWGVQQNVRLAETFALEIWRIGAVAVCPHKNTQHFHGALPDSVWLRGDLELLRRCDAIFLLPGWHGSSGARIEHWVARHRKLPIFSALDDLKVWLNNG